MTIIKQEGLGWGVLNTVIIAGVFFFTLYALNRWVAPVWAQPTV